MVGQIVRVNVAPGDAVLKGDLLVVLEAMKMENQIVAPRDGVIEELHVSVNDQVEAGRLLVLLQDEELSDEKS
jgi:biotin carboxyl carrier protein